MMALPELPLAPGEIREILEAAEADLLLVGGQALALWAELYEVSIPEELSQGISGDVDFIGSVSAANALGEKLNSRERTGIGSKWKLYRVAPEDATPQTAKLGMTVPGLGVKEIDFLGSIVGLDTKDARDDAVEVTLSSGKTIGVLHPLDVLRSRLHNLASLASKRDEHGYAQARLAISVVTAFLRQQAAEAPKRELLDHVKEIREIALDKSLAKVYFECGFDVLSCVPVEQIEDENFRQIRWPQILDEVREARVKQAKLQSQCKPWPKSLRSGGNEEAT